MPIVSVKGDQTAAIMIDLVIIQSNSTHFSSELESKPGFLGLSDETEFSEIFF